MNRWCFLFIILVGMVFLALINSNLEASDGQRQNPINGEYLGEEKPGRVPRVFGEDIPWFNDKFVQDIAISPDGKELCYVECANPDGKWDGFMIYYTRQDRKGDWSDPIKAPFMGDLKGALRPSFAPDGQTIYFISLWPRNIYRSRRTKDGWSQPEPMPAPVNSEKIENSVSVGADNTLYFCSHRNGLCDIFFANEKKSGEYETIEIEQLNTLEFNDCGPVTSPDGRYLLFHSNRKGGHGLADLYISYKQKDGQWSEPINMGNKVNTEALEVIPYFSPDGKYLFFTRRAHFQTMEPSRIYWVSTEMIEEIVKSKRP